MLLCSSCGSYRHLVAECPDSWENMKKMRGSEGDTKCGDRGNRNNIMGKELRADLMTELVDRSYAGEVAQEVIKLKQEICELRDEFTEIKVGKQRRKREKSCGNLKAATGQQQFEEQGDKIFEDVSSKLKCHTKIIDDERGIKNTVRSKCLGKTSKNKSHVILGEQNGGKLTFYDKQGNRLKAWRK